MALTALRTEWERGSYQADRNWVLKLSENADLALGKNLSGLNPHWDGRSSIAIGYGFDLLVNDNATINRCLTTANGQPTTLTDADITLLDEARARRKAGTATQAYLEDVASRLPISLLSEPAATTLLELKLTQYETALDSALDGHAQLADSKERIAILSLLYTMVDATAAAIKDQKTGIPSTLAAIKNDNRAEAWYEIRYNSNKDGGNTNRRYEESYLFGLYDNTPTFTEGEAKEVMRMYTYHRTKIDQYEHDHSPSGYGDILTNINLAKDYLINNFALGNTINGEVIVGAGLQSYAYKEKALVNDLLTATGASDLVFGEKGNDVILGGYGNDVIYGNEGNDSITGSLGDDVLLGGEGNDKYYYHAGDGNDSIIDTEGDNKIIVVENDGRQQAIGNVYREGTTNVYTTVNGKVKITHNSPWQMVMEDGSTVNLGENFQPGNFGINLLNMPDAPTNTITGDLTPLSPIQYDSLGNVIVDPNTPSPDRNDYLYDSIANDRIEGKGGNDILHAMRGGDGSIKGSIERRAWSLELLNALLSSNQGRRAVL